MKDNSHRDMAGRLIIITMPKGDELVANVKERFYNKSKETAFLDHLNDRDDVFWQALDYLSMFNEEKFKEEDAYFQHARHFITARLINHILVP